MCACQVLEALKRDGLVSKHVPKATAAEGEEAVTGANQSAYTSEQVVCYWGINFETLADTVTYKLDAMQRNISEGSGSELQSFVCPSCGTRISSLDVDYGSLLNPATGGLACPTRSAACFGSELVEDDDSASQAVVNAHKAALKVQLAGLHAALAEASSVDPPVYKKPKPKAEGAAGSGGAAGGSGGGGGGGGGARPGDAFSLGASKGIANATSAGAAPAWLLSESERAAKAAADAAAAAAAAAAAPDTGGSAADEASASAQWEAEYLRRFEESERAANGAAQPQSNSPGASTSQSSAKRPRDEGEAAAAAAEEEEEEGEEESVMVGGVSMAFSEVTEAHLDMMSTDEHQRYFELLNEDA